MGLKVGYSTNDGTFGIDLSGGLKYQNKKTNISSQGHDLLLEGEKIIGDSAYCFTKSLEKKELIPSLGVEAYLAPFKAKNFKVTAGLEKLFTKSTKEGTKIYGGFRYDF